ncbi:ranBP2-type zinc finger protein At1g67325-like isoform X2 [Miscanthus floridulus]|uniref:ranBP2-type zinc finger protein At1g67325-like isoform X2 n=1 Tax=Miscanthus floridulus TaxID=154761 RepID=UPI0034594829
MAGGGGGAGAGSGSGGGGREGDWDCGSCGNRNYAFRLLCNRCKQPRLLVDPNTPRDSKWLPRAGDWICTGCSNNNYASRKNCKKCGLPKEEAAMPALQMAGMAMPAYATYIARLQQSLAASASAYKMNFGMVANSPLQQQLLANANWPYGMAGRYGMQSSGWPFGNSNPNQFPGVPKDWRNGDWLCSCGFHNYSSRTQCKECGAPVPSGIPSTTMKATSDASSTLGTKRLASEELANDWDNKRLNPGNDSYPLSTAGPNNLFLGIEQGAGSSNGQGAFSKFDNGSSMALPSGQGMSGLMGKGCKTQKESAVHPGVL